MEFLLILQKRWSFDSVHCWNSSKLRAAIWGESGFHTTKKHNRQPLQTFGRSKKTYSKWTFEKSSGWIRTRDPRITSPTL